MTYGLLWYTQTISLLYQKDLCKLVQESSFLEASDNNFEDMPRRSRGSFGGSLAGIYTFITVKNTFPKKLFEYTMSQHEWEV